MARKTIAPVSMARGSIEVVERRCVAKFARDPETMSEGLRLGTPELGQTAVANRTSGEASSLATHSPWRIKDAVAYPWQRAALTKALGG